MSSFAQTPQCEAPTNEADERAAPPLIGRNLGVLTPPPTSKFRVKTAKNEMRLAAVEYLLCSPRVNSRKFGGITEQEFAWRTDAMLTNLNKQAFSGLDYLAPG